MQTRRAPPPTRRGGAEEATIDPGRTDLAPAAVCLGEGIGAVVTSALPARGLAVVTNVDRAVELLEHVAAGVHEVVVVDLARSGSLGLRVVEVVRALAPAARVVVVVPFASLVGDALAQGADRAVVEGDLSGLLEAVASVRDGATS